MNTPGLRAPTIRVPGLLSDDALNEQLKQFANGQNASIKQATPSSAVAMADRVKSEYLDAPTRATIKAAAPLAGPAGPIMDILASSTALSATSPKIAQQNSRAEDLSAVIGASPALGALISPAGALLSDNGPIGQLGQLTPEEQEAEHQQRVLDAQATKDQAIKDQEATRERVAGMTDNMLEVLAGPLDPGVDPVSARELREQQEIAATQRIEAAGEKVKEEENAPPPKQAWWLHGARTAMKGFANTSTSVARGAIIPLEMALGDGERSEARSWIDTVDSMMESLMPGDKARSKDFFTKLTAGGGGMVGFMAAGLAANVIGLPVSAATTMVGALQGGSDQFTDAEKFGANGMQKLLAYLGGAGLGATEAIPINRALASLEHATGGVVSRLLQTTASSSLEEFIQELGQSIGQDIVAQKIYDENRSIDWGEAFENAAVGGILGAMMGSSVGALQTAGVARSAETEGEQTRQPQPTVEEQATILESFIEQTQARFEEAARKLDTGAVAVPPAEPVGDLANVAPPIINATRRAEELAAETEQRPATQVADELARAIERPAVFDYSDQIVERGGTVPAPDADGYITLSHYATQEREVLDPAQRGTGPLRGDERARLQGEDAVDRTYYGVYSGPQYREPSQNVREYAALTDEEKAAAQLLKARGVTQGMLRSALENRYRQEQRSAGYRNEGLGNLRHEVKVKPEDLYNANEDPLNLRQQLDESATSSERVTRYERLVKEAGFRGMYFPTSALGQTAILFDQATPAQIINEQFNLPTSEIARRSDFENVTPDTFKKGGWAVVTATQEAQGDFTSEQNRANDEKLRKRLKRDKIDYMEVKGAYQGAEQGTNYLIFAPQEYAQKLGQQFSQESILTRDGLVYTDGSNRVVPSRGTTVGPEAAQQDFYSTLPDGTSFTMDLDFANEGLLAATATRNAFNEEQSRSKRGVKGEATAEADDVNLRQISDNFMRLLDLTVRQGRFTLRGKDVMGQFSTRTGVVRLRTWNDLSTLVHEGGHAMEQAASGELATFIKDNSVQLKTVAKALYGGDLSNATQKVQISEGFAEFFRVFTLNRQFAQKKMPTLTQAFEDMLRKTDPALMEGLDAIGEQFAAWLQMPSAQLVRNMIVSGEQQTGVINEAIAEIQDQGFGTWMHEVARRSIQATVNKYASLNDIVNDILNISQAERGQALDLKRADDPRVLIRLAANSGNRAMVQITDGVMGYRSTDPGTPSLRDALLRYHGLDKGGNLAAIDPERQRDFAAYVVSLRGLDEYRRYAAGLIERPPLAATQGDLRTTASEMEAKYGDDFKLAAQMVHEYGMGLWEKSYAAGLMSNETYKDGLTRQFYVPLQRDISDKAMTTGEISTSSVARGQSVVKRFRGSDRDVIDPMDVLMSKTFMLERVIAENDVKRALAKLADKAGTVGALVERVPAHKLLGESYSVQEVARQLTKDTTISEADAQDLMTILDASIEEGNRVSLFRSQQATAAGENVIFFWEDGKLAAIQLRDGEVGTDVVNTLNGIGHENLPILVDLLSHTSSTFRSAVTLWPDFLIVNFIRDQMSAFILTDVGYKPFVTGLRGVGDELRQADWARQYNAAMGVMGGMNSAAIHKARVDRDISALRNKGYVARVFGEDGMAGKIRGLARITEMSETGTRLGLFRKAYDRAKADGLTDWEASIEASYIATDYIDFGLSGSRTLLFRRVIPFLNAQLQGLYKMMRTLGADEVRQRKGLNFALQAYFKDLNNLDLSRTEKQALQTGRRAWLKMASLGLFSALLTFAFQDDPDYQDASEYLRTTGWVIPMGDGEIFYIPKPFELAILGNFVERAFEHASGDTEAKWRFLRGAAMNLTPPTSPPAIQIAIEQSANYNFFNESEIVPDYMRGLQPELQYNHYTTEFAKQLGDLMGWSPMRIDHVMSGLGASAYRDLTSMYNMTDPNRPSSDKTDWPVTRRFVRDARRGAVSSKDFWKYASTVDGKLRRAELTYKNYVEAGKERAAEDYLNELPEDDRAYAVLNTHFKADAKRLHPFYRTRQLTTIVSAIRREMVSELGVEYTGPGGGDGLKLSATEKARVDEVLSEYARREVRNTLVYMKTPGWETKAPLPTEPTLEMLNQISPELGDEFDRRVKKAKVYDASVIQDYWPDVKDRLLSDRENAFLKDVVSIAKVMR